MTYDELKKISKPHIRAHDNLPSNSLLLLVQLHIPYKTEFQCKNDFKDSVNPLYDTPAFLFIDNKGDKTVYFKTNTRYWNFYIFHEIAHFLLGHETRSFQNEIDADMLACMLAAPTENLPSTIKTARDLSTVCQIPIDKAEMYWQEINSTKKRTLYFKTRCIIALLLGIVIVSAAIYILTIQKDNNINKFNSKVKIEMQNTDTVVVTSSGTKYHLPNCRYVKEKSNLTEYDINEAINKGYRACEVCIGDKFPPV